MLIMINPDGKTQVLTSLASALEARELPAAGRGFPYSQLSPADKARLAQTEKSAHGAEKKAAKRR